MKIKDIANNTFQYPTSIKFRVTASLFLGAFIFVFLSVFQPFNLWNVEIEKRYFVALGYGIIAFCCIFLCHTVSKNYFLSHKISVKGLIVWYFFNSFITATLSAVFNDIIFNSTFLILDSFLKFQYYFFVSFATPSIILILLFRNNRVKSEYDLKYEAKEYKTSQLITLPAENPLNNFNVEASNLLYLTSTNNYIEICYLHKGEIKNALIRNTLKNIEYELKDLTDFYRCHKGYIVNLRQVIKITRVNYNIKLHLHNTKKSIPVSRLLYKEIKQKLAALKH